MYGLVINVSNVISPLCYSLIRVEPFNTCGFRCTYCYARWYRVSDEVIKPNYRSVIEFKVVAKKVYRRGLKPIPARLSTLSEPFQYVEELYKISLEVLNYALKYEYPLIINTKSTLIAKNPWFKFVRKLSDRGLVIVQFSFSTFMDNLAKVIEPIAPKPSERLKALSLLNDAGVPIVIRLSPFIPKVSLYGYEPTELIGKLRELGIKHVIVESIRLPKEELIELFRKFNVDVGSLRDYSLHTIEGKEPLYRPGHEVIYGDYLRLKELLSKNSIGFSTCKEGLFSLHTSSDCCGMYLLKTDYVKRVTLYEVYKELREMRELPIDRVEMLINELCSKQGYICARNMSSYPKRIKRRFKAHELRLIRVIKNSRLLTHASPEFEVHEGIIKVR
ncbi:MAG TPA: radical SAM protein [Acidilobales archaeon]|nr:radical SAM protein [Acidilobales archaeon]